MDSKVYSMAPVNGSKNIPWRTRRVYNRTGAATVANRVYMLDEALATAVEAAVNSKGELLPAVTTQNWPGADAAAARDSSLGNIILPTTAGLPTHNFVVALEAVADNELCLVLESGEVSITMTGTLSTTIPAGAPVFGVNATSVAGSGLTVFQASIVASTAKILGKTLAAATYDGANTAQAVNTHFNGCGGFR